MAAAARAGRRWRGVVDRDAAHEAPQRLPRAAAGGEQRVAAVRDGDGGRVREAGRDAGDGLGGRLHVLPPAQHKHRHVGQRARLERLRTSGQAVQS